jgi:hypothetical protein
MNWLLRSDTWGKADRLKAVGGKNFKTPEPRGANDARTTTAARLDSVLASSFLLLYLFSPNYCTQHRQHDGGTRNPNPACRKCLPAPGRVERVDIPYSHLPFSWQLWWGAHQNRYRTNAEGTEALRHDRYQDSAAGECQSEWSRHPVRARVSSGITEVLSAGRPVDREDSVSQP